MRKILGILLALSLALFLSVPALAASGDVTYLAYNAETGEFDPQTKAAGDYTVVTGSTTTWSAGWYVVSGNVTINGNIRVTNSSDLILMDNSTLTVIGSIIVPFNRRLTIYAQSTGDDAGKLIAIGKQQYQAGIGGGNNSGIGSITINGGVVTATGGQYGAGIGGSYTTTTTTTSGQVTINGGVVTATGGTGAAGIGSGYGSKASVSVTVTINGGAVTATGGERGAGIGGGDNGAGTVTINGGTVTSTGGTGAAGIGGGYTNISTSNVTISGGFVTATGGGSNGAAIGTGSPYGNNGTESGTFSNCVVLKKSGWATTMTGTVYGSPTLTTDATVPNGITLTIPAGSTLTIDGDATLTNNGTITVGDTLQNDGTIVNNGTINGTVTGSGRIIVDGNIVIDENTTNKTGAASLAHEVAPAYTVTIPASVTLGGTATVKAEGVRVDYGKQVVVRLGSGSALTVALEGDDSEKLDYTVSVSGQKVAAGGAVLAVNPANATGDTLAGGTATLSFALADTAVVKYSGSYTGTVTFTVSVDKASEDTGDNP